MANARHRLLDSYLTEEEWRHICYEAISRNDEKWLDALYYTLEDEQEAILACWEERLHYELTQGHVCGFISDLGGLRGKKYRGKN